MSLPPDHLPAGLSPREYRRLGIKYLLMGKNDKATEAFTLGYEPDGDGKDENGGEPQPRGYQEGVRFGASITKAVMKLLQEHTDRNEGSGKNQEPQASSDSPEEEELEEDEQGGSEYHLNEIKEQLVALGVPEEKADRFVEELVEAVNTAKSGDTPPREVPTDLSPRELYELGVHYKQLGWTEQARDALTYAMEGDPDGDWGVRSKQFFQARLPRHPVPLMAEQRNIEGFNLMAEGDMEGARLTFRKLINDYPDFEWPYGNLGYLYLSEGNLKEANRVLEQALDINPNYLNGWLHLARVRALEDDLVRARECVENADKLLPDDRDVQNIAKFIDELMED